MAVNTREIAKRALHTFWQAFLAALVVAYAASGLDVSQVVDMNSAKKFLLALAVAVLGAALSAAKTTVSGLIGQPSNPTPPPAVSPPVAPPVQPPPAPPRGSVDQATAFQQTQPPTGQ